MQNVRNDYNTAVVSLCTIYNSRTLYRHTKRKYVKRKILYMLMYDCICISTEMFSWRGLTSNPHQHSTDRQRTQDKLDKVVNKRIQIHIYDPLLSLLCSLMLIFLLHFFDLMYYSLKYQLSQFLCKFLRTVHDINDS